MMAEERLTLSLRQYRVAFETVIEAFEQVRRTGQIEQPQLASAALVELDELVTSMMLVGLDKVRYDGSHVNELLRRGRALLEGSEFDGS